MAPWGAMIGLMAKDPAGGKRRLAAGLGEARAAALARAFLADSAALAREVAWRAGCGAIAFAEGAPHLPGWEVRPQPPGDLGARLAAAMAALGGPALILGTDAPTLPPALLELALHAVRAGADAAVVPALDGGYCALAVARPLPALLVGIPWSSPGVLGATRAAAAAAGLRLRELPCWHDVDTADDLPALRETLAGRAPPGCAALPPWPAPATRTALEVGGG